MTVTLSVFCNPDNLEFRTACNEAVDSTRRPVKQRVIERLSALPETDELVRELISRPDGVGAISPISISAALVSDSRWRTLVVESVSEERSWKDLFTGKFSEKLTDKLIDWFLSLFEKICDRKEHPVTAGLASLTVTLAIPFAIAHFDPPLYTNLIEPVVKPIRLAVTPKLEDLDLSKLQEKITDANLSVPVQLTLDPKTKQPIPILFDCEGASNPSPRVTRTDCACDKAIKEVRATRAFLKQIADSTKSIQQSSDGLKSKMPEELDTLNGHFKSMAEAAGAMTTNLANLKKAVEENSTASIAAGNRAALSVDTELRALTRAAQDNSIPIVLQKGKPRVVVLRILDPSTRAIRPNKFRVNFDSFEGAAGSETVTLTVNDKPLKLAVGDTQAFADPSWNVMAQEVDKHGSKAAVRLSLSPAITFSDTSLLSANAGDDDKNKDHKDKSGSPQQGSGGSK